MATQNEKNALNALVGICEMEQERNYASMSKFFDDLFSAFHNFKDSKAPEFVESTYTGIHLNETYEEGDFLKMIEQFRNNKMLHAKYALQIVNDAIKLHKNFANISNCNLASSSLPAVIIVGDLHGSFKDLYYIIQQFGTPGKKNGFVFNGDYVDRGPQQCEVLLTLLYAFLLYPNRVFLNRGNHEDLSLNLSSHFAPNFQTDCVKKFDQFGNVFFKQAQEFFRYLPIATVVTNKVGYKCFVIHGGISERTNLNYVASRDLNRSEFGSVTLKDNNTADKRKQAEQFCDLLWSDPLKQDTKPFYSKNGCYPNKNRGVGFLFGEDVSERFCKKNNFDVIVRSHEVRQDGYSRDHPYCWTIFSCSNYCNGTNSAAVLILHQQNNYLKINMFKNKELDNDAFLIQKDFLISTFKTYLENHAPVLLDKFEKVDVNKTGWVSIKDWANIIADYVAIDYPPIDPKHLIELRDNILPCNDKLGLAKYQEMFKLKCSGKARQLFQFLDNIFSMIDIDQNGTISKSEANKAIHQINSMLGTNYTADFIAIMDKNKDGLIDIKEFKEGFSNAFGLV